MFCLLIFLIYYFIACFVKQYLYFSFLFCLPISIVFLVFFFSEFQRYEVPIRASQINCKQSMETKQIARVNFHQSVMKNSRSALFGPSVVCEKKKLKLRNKKTHHALHIGAVFKNKRKPNKNNGQTPLFVHVESR